MRRYAMPAAALLLALRGAPAIGAAEPGATSAPTGRLTNARSSIADLVEDLRQALMKGDKQALRAIRVNHDEYVDIILPGSVDPGQPRAKWGRDAKQYFWGTLNGKSLYTEATLAQEYGGHEFRVTGIDYRKGIKQYADYKAYRQLVLTLENDAGQVNHLRIGSVAEVDGQFKFISYIRD